MTTIQRIPLPHTTITIFHSLIIYFKYFFLFRKTRKNLPEKKTETKTKNHIIISVNYSVSKPINIIRQRLKIVLQISFYSNFISFHFSNYLTMLTQCFDACSNLIKVNAVFFFFLVLKKLINDESRRQINRTESTTINNHHYYHHHDESNNGKKIYIYGNNKKTEKI